MNINNNLVITISRQLGSGGAFIGKKLADKLDFFYLDYDIVKKAAEKLNTEEESIESCDEKLNSFWNFINLSYTNPDFNYYIPPTIALPTDKEVFKIQSEFIKCIAKEKSAVIIGRCGFYLLKEIPRHISLFLHADMEFREKRVAEIYNLPVNKARRLINSTDKKRNHYMKFYTGFDMENPNNYHLCLNTSVLGFEKTEKLVINYINERFNTNFDK